MPDFCSLAVWILVEPEQLFTQLLAASVWCADIWSLLSGVQVANKKILALVSICMFLYVNVFCFAEWKQLC